MINKFIFRLLQMNCRDQFTANNCKYTWFLKSYIFSWVKLGDCRGNLFQFDFKLQETKSLNRKQNQTTISEKKGRLFSRVNWKHTRRISESYRMLFPPPSSNSSTSRAARLVNRRQLAPARRAAARSMAPRSWTFCPPIASHCRY